MNTIEIPSKINFTKHLRDALRALERIPTHLQTVAILGAIKDIDESLSTMESNPIKRETLGRILVLNTETGSSEVLMNDSKMACDVRFKRLMETKELSEEPSKFKVMLQVSLIPDHWHTAHQLFAHRSPIICKIVVTLVLIISLSGALWASFKMWTKLLTWIMEQEDDQTIKH